MTQGLKDETLLCHPIPPQSRKALPVHGILPLNVSKPVSVFWPVWKRSGLGEEKGRVIWVGTGWSWGSSHPVPQGLRQIILCLSTW